MTALLRRIAAFLAAAGFSVPAFATAYGIDYSDLWFNPDESGWGLNLSQQHETIFATLFVYGDDGQPHWFVADDLRGGANNTFTGLLYQTSGPSFSGPWTGGVQVTPVGAMTLAFNDYNSATLTYIVNGATFTKTIQRQTFRANNLEGSFTGGTWLRASACPNPQDNGTFALVGLVTMSQGENTSMIIDFALGPQQHRCTFTGPYTATGRLGRISGEFTCTHTSAVGTFTITELDVTRNGFTGALNGSDGFCNISGHVGGVRRIN